MYIPLGGNRRGPFRTYANLMVVMLLGGLWHGASWTFVIWGAIHGGMLVIERLQGKTSAYRRLPRPLRVGITFAIVCIAWVFFRADTLGRAVDYLSCLFGAGRVADASDLAAGVIYTPYHVVMFLIAVLLVWRAPQSWAFTRNLTLGRAVACLLFFAVSVLLMWTQTENPFLYFQF